MMQVAGLLQRLVRAMGIALACSAAFSPSALATTTAGGSAVVEWDPSPDPSVVGYKLYYGVASGHYTNDVLAGYTNQATILNLVPGTTYYAVVTSLDAAGLESGYSNEASYLVPPGNVVSGAPPTLSISNLGNGAFAVSGTGTPGQPYTIQYTADPLSASNWQTLASVTADGSGAFTLSDTAGTAPRFYRAVAP